MVLVIAPLNKRSTYQRRFYNRGSGGLIGTGYSTAAQANSAHSPRNGLWTRSYAASRHTTPQSTTQGLYPVIHVPKYMD